MTDFQTHFSHRCLLVGCSLTNLILLSLVLLVCVACSASVPTDEGVPSQDMPKEEQPYKSNYDEPPGWATVFQPRSKHSSGDKEAVTVSSADAVSTMYVDSYPENFGSITKLTVYANDNEGIPYNIYSYYKKSENTVYLFLPSSADLSSVTVRALHNSGVETGTYTLDFTETTYGVYFGSNGSYCSVIAKQSGIPTLFVEINEEYGSISDMHRDPSHETECFGDMALVVSDELAQTRKWAKKTISRENDPTSPGTIKVRGRGNWTWNQNKKPYQLTFEKPTDLLGMGKAKKWILLANVMDASLLRNQLFYELAADMKMPYSVDIEPVDLFLNGNYMGSYSLCEKVEVGENRVAIDPDSDYLLELDHYYQSEQYTFTTNHGKNFTVHSPENKRAVAAIKKIIDSIEADIYEEGDSLPQGIDANSFIRYWWLQDLSRNNDTFIGSNFFYYVSEEEKLYAGPIWDMDNTLGIWGGGENLMPKGWHSSNRGWLKHLAKNSAFWNALALYYRSDAEIMFGNLPDRINELADYIRESADMNYTVNSRNDYVNSRTGSWEEDIAYLKSFLEKRLAWYSSQFN